MYLQLAQDLSNAVLFFLMSEPEGGVAHGFLLMHRKLDTEPRAA